MNDLKLLSCKKEKVSMFVRRDQSRIYLIKIKKKNKSEILNTQQKSKKSLVFVIATSPLFLYNTQNYLIKILIVIIAMLNVCKLQA